MTPVLELQDLHVLLCTHRHQGVELVKGVSFSVYPGECLGILGESGSGKSMSMKNLLVRLGPKAPRYYVQIMAFILIVTYMITPALAVEDMWTAANRIIVDVYNKIAGISTVLAGLMSAVAVIGAKVSNNQHKTDQAWDWLKRIWIAWAIINGMGAFLAYVRPLFDGLATIQ